MVRTLLSAAAIALFAAVVATAPRGAASRQIDDKAHALAAASDGAPLFRTSHECLACHNGLTAPSGEDVSIGVAWRASMMANSSRDPYWQASVRREVIDHPAAAHVIEDECAICHMPMSSTMARLNGAEGEIFVHLPVAGAASEDDRLAADGVSCTLCHQITPERLGTPQSFVGGFVIGGLDAGGARRMFGPYEVDAGRGSVMRSATGATPAEAAHLRESEVCATCHTLYTQALGPDGKVVGRLAEQVPYLEWRHSAFAQERSCQSCHMPEVAGPARISSVLGRDRERLGRHSFLGGNFFMLRMLGRYRAELGVEALPHELEAAARNTIAQLQQDTATVTLGQVSAGRELAFDVTVRNLTGHKLPTGYPSRRAWLHVTVHDAAGDMVFSSGAVEPSGAIDGNDNDADPSRFEPHYAEIRRPDQVQIYESMMGDAAGAVTTGLLAATAYVKDNRLLPRGFDKATAHADISVIGEAADDRSFTAETDIVRYVIDAEGRQGPFRIDAELRYQPISFRWAQNLKAYDAPEPRSFTSKYDAMSSGSSVVLTRARLMVR